MLRRRQDARYIVICHYQVMVHVSVDSTLFYLVSQKQNFMHLTRARVTIISKCFGIRRGIPSLILFLFIGIFELYHQLNL